MNIQPTNQQPISDDQELAKVLAGITASADQTAASLNDDTADQDAASTTAPAPAAPAQDSQDDMVTGNPEAVPPSSLPTFDPTPAPAPVAAPVAPAGNLESIKSSALNELRPLVDKLNVSAQEKFDTYLLLIRSTDDTSLISPAFEAARGITDEAAKAQALLDVVKEIDYLSNPQKPVA